MKGLLHWFKKSSKMKRWIFLMLIGIILACYGIAEILVLKEVSFGEIAKIAGIFVLGFVCIVLGLIGANKRTLELLVEASDDRMENKKNVNVKSLTGGYVALIGLKKDGSFYDLSSIFYKNCKFINVFKDRFKNKLLNSNKENILQIYR